MDDSINAIFELLWGQPLVLLLGVARITGAFTALSFLGTNVLGGPMARTAISVGVMLALLPLVSDQLAGFDGSVLETVVIGFKEALIGLAMGATVVFVFWGVEAVGNFLDNQRGASMAQSFDPLSGSQASPLAIFMGQTMVVFFFVTGLFVEFLFGLYQSFELWPIPSYLPEFSRATVIYFVEHFAYIAVIAVVVGGPIAIAMFLSEFGLGIISRFAPQLNVFFLAMPVKSAVAVFLLMLYWSTLILYLGDLMNPAERFRELQETMR